MGRSHGFDWTAEVMDMIRQRYPTEGQFPLAKELGVSPSAVRQKACAMGVGLAHRNRNQGEAQARNNTSVNWRYFDEWSPNMAYVLGYIFADGGISKNGRVLYLGCAIKDEEYLIGIARNELKSQHKIRYRPAVTSSIRRGDSFHEIRSGPHIKISVHSRLLVDGLKRHGVVNRKSFKDEPFPYVPDEYLGDFARGNLDGDGNVCIPSYGSPSIGFLGSQRFIRGLLESACRLAGVTVVTVGRKGEHGLFGLQWSGVANLRKFHSWLYPTPDCLHLSRKRKLLECALEVAI